jgi:hypothetical protein
MAEREYPGARRRAAVAVLWSLTVLAIAPMGAWAGDKVLPASPADRDAAQEGLRIAQEADRRDQGFGDSVARLKMILTNRHGDSSERELTIKTLEVTAPGLGDKSLVVFDRPRDIKGTALLTFSKILKPDDQWVFLPATKRVRRISSVNKSGSFMGSEFSYEDMSGQEPGKYHHVFLRREPCGKLTCFVVERRPLYPYSGYTREIVWYDTAQYRVLKIDFYDRKNSRLKTLIAGRYKRYLGKFWRAHSLLMSNHQTGKKTRLLWSDFRFQTGLTDADFTRTSIERTN